MRYAVAVIRQSDAFLEALRTGRSTGFDDQYMRMSPQFETGSPDLAWLCDRLWLAEGRVAADHRIEDAIFEAE